ncbi:hypothetical protein KFU94_36905 [Chloroflexi bacterium TSY]|nr:hypothetical protein [Chloroflexi bacterium TSY]
MTKRGKITRREFTKLMGIASGSALLTGCAAGSVPAEVAAPQDSSQAPAVQTLKTARIAMDASVTSADTLDPAYRTSGTDGVLQAAFYEGLVSRDPSLTPIPELAESWEPNEDGSEWTFKLREGVTFHDGKPFVAADVVYTYQRLIDPDVGSPGASNFSALTPDGIVAVDDHTVRIRLTQPDVDFPNTTVFSQSLIVPEGATNDDLATSPMGTGPFKLEGFVPGETTTTASKYEGYWRPGEPKVDVLEILSIPEAEARVAALQGGQVDIIMRTPPTKLDALESDPGIALVENLIGTSIVAYCHADTPPFDDNNICWRSSTPPIASKCWIWSFRVVVRL